MRRKASQGVTSNSHIKAAGINPVWVWGLNQRLPTCWFHHCLFQIIRAEHRRRSAKAHLKLIRLWSFCKLIAFLGSKGAWTFCTCFRTDDTLNIVWVSCLDVTKWLDSAPYNILNEVALAVRFTLMYDKWCAYESCPVLPKSLLESSPKPPQQVSHI